MPIISIEGNIGSGKSTLVKGLNESAHFKSTTPPFLILQEPVDEWNTICDENGKTILENFYGDQHRFSFSFQMMAYISRLALLKKAHRENPGAIIITERCLDTDRRVFAAMLYDEGKISQMEMTIYLKWFDEFVKEVPVDGYVFLDTEPSVAYQRVLKRGRQGESIPIEYLTKCDDYHKNWAANHIEPELQIHIDANSENTPSVIDEQMEKINAFIHARLQTTTNSSPSLKTTKPLPPPFGCFNFCV
jgi:deoxyadenosine/deoxycytidine kinase